MSPDDQPQNQSNNQQGPLQPSVPPVATPPTTPVTPSSFASPGNNTFSTGPSPLSTGPDNKSKKTGLMIVVAIVAAILSAGMYSLAGKIRTETPSSRTTEQSKYQMNTLTRATDSQKAAFRTAIDGATTPAELQTNMTAAFKQYFNSIDTKVYDKDHFPSLCVLQQCLDENKVGEDQTFTAGVDVASMKLQAQAIADAVTAMPIELAHTTTPAVYVFTKGPLNSNIISSDAVNKDISGYVFGTLGYQRVVLPVDAGIQQSPQERMTTITHELGHVFNRVQLITFKEGTGFKGEWQKIETRPYTAKVESATNSYVIGDEPKDGYVSTYAQFAYGEDLAETFVYLANDNWSGIAKVSTIKDPIAKAKAELMAKYIRRFVPKI